MMHKIDLSQVDPNQEPEAQPDEPQVQPDKPQVDETSSNHNNDNSMNSIFTKSFLIIALLVVIGGVTTGYGGFKLQGEQGEIVPKPSDLQRTATKDQIQVGDVFGVEDKSTFKDSAEGYLEIGGSNGEGSHKLLRPGGDSQTVYLTSSITDLDDFDGMEVKIWGETFKGQEVGWLMDVGRIEVVETNGQTPIEE